MYVNMFLNVDDDVFDLYMYLNIWHYGGIEFAGLLHN